MTHSLHPSETFRVLMEKEIRHHVKYRTRRLGPDGSERRIRGDGDVMLQTGMETWK